MADAMEQKRVYELFGVRADFYRPAMEKRGYFQREKANLKLAKIKVFRSDGSKHEKLGWSKIQKHPLKFHCTKIL